MVRATYPDEGYRKQVFAVWNEDLRRRCRGEIGQSPVREYRVTCADGSIKDVEITFAVEGGHTYVVFHDVTARKRAEEASQQAHQELERRVAQRTAQLEKANAELDLFRRFAEASGQGFGMANRDGFFTYMNPAACRIVGAAGPEDVIGKHLTAFYPDGYMSRRETEILPALLREGYWEGEVVFSAAAKTRSILQHSFLIRDQKGRPALSPA